MDEAEVRGQLRGEANVQHLLAITSSVHAQRFNQKRVYEGQRDGTWEATLMIGSQGTHARLAA